MSFVRTVVLSMAVALPGTAMAQVLEGPYAGLQFGGSNIDTNVGVDGNGGSFGGFAGYNFYFGQAMLGAEVDYDATNYELSGGAGDVDSTARFKLRGGYDLGGGLAFFTAGWVRATTSALGDDNGYFYGIGYDYPVTDQIFVGAELLKHEFDDFNNLGVDVDVTTFKVRGGFNF